MIVLVMIKHVLMVITEHGELPTHSARMCEANPKTLTLYLRNGYLKVTTDEGRNFCLQNVSLEVCQKKFMFCSFRVLLIVKNIKAVEPIEADADIHSVGS